MNTLLKKETPERIISLLDKMCKGDVIHEPLPNHPLFCTDRWSWMLISDSYYFDGDTRSTLRFDKIANQYYLNIQCNLKNYNREIEKFIDWIMPYIDNKPGSFLGYMRSELRNEPTLIYVKEQ